MFVLKRPGVSKYLSDGYVDCNTLYHATFFKTFEDAENHRFYPYVVVQLVEEKKEFVLKIKDGYLFWDKKSSPLVTSKTNATKFEDPENDIAFLTQYYHEIKDININITYEEI